LFIFADLNPILYYGGLRAKIAGLLIFAFLFLAAFIVWETFFVKQNLANSSQNNDTPKAEGLHSHPCDLSSYLGAPKVRVVQIEDVISSNRKLAQKLNHCVPESKKQLYQLVCDDGQECRQRYGPEFDFIAIKPQNIEVAVNFKCSKHPFHLFKKNIHLRHEIQCRCMKTNAIVHV